MWGTLLKDFENYLRIERGMSDNSIQAYLSDIEKFCKFISIYQIEETPSTISSDSLRLFLYEEAKGLHARSQSRLISSLKSFFKSILLSRMIGIYHLRKIRMVYMCINFCSCDTFVP